jgi:glycosyltransferase involved in cell wall biosynthesis
MASPNINSNVAIFYKIDGYNTQGKRLLGRQAAGEGFLKGIVRHGTGEILYCYTDNQNEFDRFCQSIQPWIDRSLSVKWLSAEEPNTLSEASTLYKPDPRISPFAWQRRFHDQRSYSICGITHTIASQEMIQTISDLTIAPVQPWDALICTSNAVKTAVDRIIENWSEYLAMRLGSKPKIEFQLPVIPLGVDCSTFKPNSDLRQQLRKTLGIGANDIVILFVGRLIFYAKAHPVPMYLALEKVAQTSKTKIHLVQAGWFEEEREEIQFKETAKIFCPSVNHLFLDGRKPEVRSGVWSAADIFISLADNIQETFGLTPIEAMAAGLPVIVSDWNGYKESVRHEVDGFRIPTLAPAPESALDLACAYQVETLNYSTYIAHASMVTSIDINACAEALTKLIEDPQLRHKLGQNGQQRARDTYDWQVIIAAYERLWQQLAEIRQASAMSVPPTANVPASPLCDDPFRLFAHYSTQVLTDDVVLQLGDLGTPEKLQQLRSIWITNFGAAKRISDRTLEAIVSDLQQNGSLSVREILNRYGSRNSGILSRTLVYLLKFNVLQLTEKNGQSKI